MRAIAKGVFVFTAGGLEPCGRTIEATGCPEVTYCTEKIGSIEEIGSTEMIKYTKG
jgi:hypothetical protein